ncbi:Uncharacterised protein [Dermatophilus congolensis]|uniref:DUF5063 domain-containing protein n=1 Tax=Dermatophilus congolensis TaxID=1863 RepID=A0AA46H1J3_9MICO|nr:DUF5063 domain-containing protein [Dermatophilus congolensis]STD15638.1 Uncharacterised protein [Dermatophilus congolensis]
MSESVQGVGSSGGQVPDDLVVLAEETALEARTFLAAARGVAGGASPETAIPLLLLAVSQVLVTGARLGAIMDVVPFERFEPDLGSQEDVDDIRDGLAALLRGIDEYVDVVDPLLRGDVVSGSLSGDIADVASDLMHGLRHHAEGAVSEALWWWQFSYLATWGSRAASALRVLQSLLAHIRLDADEDAIAQAQFEALHADEQQG